MHYEHATALGTRNGTLSQGLVEGYASWFGHLSNHIKKKKRLEFYTQKPCRLVLTVTYDMFVHCKVRVLTFNRSYG